MFAILRYPPIILILLMSLSLVFITIFSIAASVSSADIKPLYAGTIVLDDYILRHNTCIFRTLPLPLSKIEYQSHPNTNVIATISQLSIDQLYAFEFRYEILCPESACFIDFTFSRYTQNINQHFQYRMVIDFLVAENMITSTFNMTYFKADINLTPSLQTSSNALLQQHEWDILLIPNGFNNVTMTGHISQKVQTNINKLILLYEDNTNGHSTADFMGWPLNQNFVLFKIVFLPKKQLITSSTCETNNVFKGFLSTTLASINLNTHGLTEEGKESKGELELVMGCTSEFKDQRQLKVEPKNQLIIKKVGEITQTKYMLVIFAFLIAELAYLLFKKHASNNGNNKKDVKLPELLISFETTQIVMTNQLKNVEKCETNDNIHTEQIDDDHQ